MSLLGLIVVIVLVGLALYVVNLIPMEATVKRILNIAVIVLLVLWLLTRSGLLAPLANVRV